MKWERFARWVVREVATRVVPAVLASSAEAGRLQRRYLCACLAVQQWTRIVQLLIVVDSAKRNQKIRLPRRNAGVQVTPDRKKVGTQTIDSATVGVQTQDVLEVVGSADTATQTQLVGAAAGWERLVFRVRKLSYLRRLKSQLAEYTREFDNLYTRTR